VPDDVQTREASQRDATPLIQDFNRLREHRRHWDDQWQEIADHGLGRRDYTVKREPGRQRNVRIYDTTMADSNGLLAAALHALLTNPSTSWFDLAFQSPQFNEIDESARWLEAVRQVMTNSFRRPESGFTTQMHEFYTDLTGFCTACVFVEDDVGKGPSFSARPMGEIFIDEDFAGNITVTYRKFTLKAWQAVAQFGKKNVPRAQDNVKHERGDVEMDFIHLVRKRDQPLPGNIFAQGMPWESIYVDLDSSKVILEGGYHEMPYLTSRWSKDAGELYGRGPGITSLPSAKMLNAIWRTYIRSAEKQADPPLLVEDDGVMPGSQLRTTPNSQISIRPTGSGQPPVQYLEHRGRYDVADNVIETFTSRIQRAFHNEIIQAFQDPRMTATQVIELARLSQRILSPVLGRMQTEILEPMINRTFGILSRANAFPPPPDFLQGQELRIDYVSPVARAQRASESQAVLDTFTALAAMAEADPGVLDNFNFDEAARTLGDGNGIPLKVIRPRKEVGAIREERQRQQEEQQQLEQALQLAETASKFDQGGGAQAAPAQGQTLQ